jgi:hypothetical protein
MNLVALARSILLAPFERSNPAAVRIEACRNCSWIDPNIPPPERVRANCEACCGRGYIVTQTQEASK